MYKLPKFKLHRGLYIVTKLVLIRLTNLSEKIGSFEHGILLAKLIVTVLMKFTANTPKTLDVADHKWTNYGSLELVVHHVGIKSSAPNRLGADLPKLLGETN